MIVEHAVIIHIALSDENFGSAKDHETISFLEENISIALEAADFGELDGDEFGEGECVIYTYGPDADILFSLIVPLLASGTDAYKGYAIKRYGEADDPQAREVRVNW